MRDDSRQKQDAERRKKRYLEEIEVDENTEEDFDDFEDLELEDIFSGYVIGQHVEFFFPD